MNQADVIIVGGGAAGLMAAGTAARQGAKTILLEKMERCGRKLLITGKGRCNITNATGMADFISHIHNGKFLRPAFSSFFIKEIIGFFEEMGVQTMTERGNRVFPVSEKAEDVVNALLRYCRQYKVDIHNRVSVMHLLIEDHEIRGVSAEMPDGNKFEFTAPKVIIATGGKSYPGTGSTGDGYRLAGEAGHTVVQLRPALVPLTTSGSTAKELMGLSLKNVNVSLWIDGKKKASEFGEMLFTHFGLSGPVVLTLSGPAAEAAAAGHKTEISIDLKPALDEQKLDARLLRDLNEQGKKKFDNFLGGLLPSSLIPVCCKLVNIDPDKPCHQVSANERKILRIWLKDFRFEITGNRSFREAIVTAGGVSLNEVNPANLGSKIIKGLHFAGEVLDLDADTGGYNLQIAFSTGYSAAKT